MRSNNFQFAIRSMALLRPMNHVCPSVCRHLGHYSDESWLFLDGSYFPFARGKNIFLELCVGVSFFKYYKYLGENSKNGDLGAEKDNAYIVMWKRLLCERTNV